MMERDVRAFRAAIQSFVQCPKMAFGQKGRGKHVAIDPTDPEAPKFAILEKSQNLPVSRHLNTRQRSQIL